ncbi:hypothetical protein VNO78_06257 [Psophocarpus tetragonolobus]|uniref:Uncharacterized protein n=1 Tax=Psophocarpus tetragonolobus TaxID=3891 RepID=A0AAN9SUS3_PSOTE
MCMGVEFYCLIHLIEESTEKCVHVLCNIVFIIIRRNYSFDFCTMLQPRSIFEATIHQSHGTVESKIE